MRRAPRLITHHTWSQEPGSHPCLSHTTPQVTNVVPIALGLALVPIIAHPSECVGEGLCVSSG